MMNTYLVGGAVRDALLGRTVKERDWVVVGATPEEMRAKGYQPVGKDFPVFLHPQTRQEYALARTERKTAPGYHGFEVHASPEVSLNQDLARRDLTINAMARTETGELIDPYGGRDDIEARKLRHISPAFAEDPVRILRVARFAARYASLGFDVAGETQALMQQMVTAGEVDALVPERVWREWAGALAEPTPSAFVRTLRQCGALNRLLPELDRLFGIPQPPKHHPEIDTGVHTLLVVDQAARLSPDSKVRFAALTHDLGKGTTPAHQWPSHRGHEERGVGLIDTVCDRYRIPNAYRELARLVSRYHLHCHRAAEFKPATLFKLLEGLDALRRRERFEQFLSTCEADARGRLGLEDRDYSQPDLLRRALQAAAQVRAAPLVERGFTGEGLAQALRETRIQAIGVSINKC